MCAEDDVGPVDIEGSDVENDLEHEDAIERMDCAEHPVSREALKEVLFREKDWKRCLAGRDNRTKFALSRLKQVVEAMGGLPNVTVNVEGERPLDGALRRAMGPLLKHKTCLTGNPSTWRMCLEAFCAR